MILSYTTGRSSNTVIGATQEFPEGLLPPLAITSFLEVNNLQEMFALEVQEGDIVLRLDTRQTYVALNSNNGGIGDWRQIETPVVVKSVNGYIGEVDLDKADVGLSDVTNDPQLKISANLSDIDNVQFCRDNLEVYSKAEIDAQNTTLTEGTTAVNDNLAGHASNLDVHRQISDETITNVELWSSQKINSELNEVHNNIAATTNNVGLLKTKIALLSSF